MMRNELSLANVALGDDIEDIAGMSAFNDSMANMLAKSRKGLEQMSPKTKELEKAAT